MRKIYNCDATDLASKVDADSVACVFTSPPYNIGIENPDGLAEYEFDSRKWDDYVDLATGTASALHTVMVDGGRAWINVQSSVPYDPNDKKERRRVDLTSIWSQAMVEAGFAYRDTIVWVQDSFDGACAWGSWGRPSAPNLRGSHEFILLFYKPHPDTDGWRRPTPSRWANWKDDRDGLGGDLTDLYRNVWKIKPARSKYKATFPIELPARGIRLSAWPDETVLDPFVGTGTTLLAAEQIASQWGVKRKAIGIEKSAEMAKVAKEAEV